jgi:hypothetical protein
MVAPSAHQRPFPTNTARRGAAPVASARLSHTSGPPVVRTVTLELQRRGSPEPQCPNSLRGRSGGTTAPPLRVRASSYSRAARASSRPLMHALSAPERFARTGVGRRGFFRMISSKGQIRWYPGY